MQNPVESRKQPKHDAREAQGKSEKDMEALRIAKAEWDRYRLWREAEQRHEAACMAGR